MMIFLKIYFNFTISYIWPHHILNTNAIDCRILISTIHFQAYWIVTSIYSTSSYQSNRVKQKQPPFFADCQNKNKCVMLEKYWGRENWSTFVKLNSPQVFILKKKIIIITVISSLRPWKRCSAKFFKGKNQLPNLAWNRSTGSKLIKEFLMAFLESAWQLRNKNKNVKWTWTLRESTNFWNVNAHT